MKTPLGSKAQQVANQRNTMTKYFPVLHEPGHSNESFPMRERLLHALPQVSSGLGSRVDVACQTEDSSAAAEQQLKEAKEEQSVLHKELSSLRCAARVSCNQPPA